MSTQTSKKGSGCLKFLLLFLSFPFLVVGVGFLVVVVGTVFTSRSDKQVLSAYQPTPEIADIAEKNTLTDKGKAELYRADPTFVDASTFIQYCQTISRGIDALACNAPKPRGGPFGGRQIFLLQIDDPRFIDHKYAASVHEMLHSAYQRLGSKEKERINEFLDQELSLHQDDGYLMGVVDLVKTKKNGQKAVLDELHSKFGVEYLELSPGLEEYYRRYFTDRQRVVELYKQGGFNSRVRRLGELNYEMQNLESKLASMQSQLVSYRDSGNIDNYNSLVGEFNSMVNQFNSKVAENRKIFNEVKEFYQYFNPDYKPPEAKKQ